MSAAGFVEESSYDRQRHLTFGCLIFIVLVFLLAVMSSGILFGCYLASHRDDGIAFHLSANVSDLDRVNYVYEPGHENEGDINDVMHSNVTTQHSVTSPTWLPTTAVEISYRQLSDTVDSLWQAAASRYLTAGTDYALHFQGRTNRTDVTDRAPKRLFQKMMSDIRRYSPVHKKFVRLLNNYDDGDDDVNRKRKQKEEADFLDEVLQSETFITLERFLAAQKLLTTEFRSELYDLWFRSSEGRSSAFQTVFVGVRHQSRVFGLNNWIQFYLLEKAKRINYQGYLGKNQIGLLQVRFTWDGDMKPLSTMFIGTSPDFELALYSLCYYVRAPERCSFSVQGQDISIEYVEATWGTEFVIDMSGTLA